MSLDNLLHALGGALIAAACFYLPPVALALFMPLFVGWVRESEQARAGHSIHRPSNVFAWSRHRQLEAASWLVGALAATGLYALR